VPIWSRIAAATAAFRKDFSARGQAAHLVGTRRLDNGDSLMIRDHQMSAAKAEGLADAA
jgi:hypothetical protein